MKLCSHRSNYCKIVHIIRHTPWVHDDSFAPCEIDFTEVDMHSHMNVTEIKLKSLTEKKQKLHIH